MLKPALIIILSLFVYQTALAQKDTSVYYLNSYGKIVTKKYAELYILILPPDPSANKELFPVDGFYMDGKKLFTATSITKSLPLNFQGNYVTYFKNGYKMSIKQYDHGTFTGDETLFYPNGKFYCKISMVSTPSFVFTDDEPGKFYSKKTLVSNKDITELQFTDCSDSTGKVLAKNGNGYWITFNDDFSRVTQKGKIVNGLQDSVWQMSPDENNTYSLIYKNGKILKDKNFLDKRINTSVEQVPSFPGGLEAFGEFLGYNIKYPAEARENRVQGRVIISFVVEKDGSLTSVKVERGIGFGCDEEAVRVIELSPKWKPGIQNGKPVRVAYSVPINFTLSHIVIR